MAEAIPIIIAIAGTAASVYSTVSSSQAQAHAEHTQERMVRTQAEQSRIASEQKAADYQRRAKAALATERAQRGASGITMAGTPLLTYFENAKTFEEDIQRIKQGQEVEQRGYAQQAGLHRDYAGAEKEAGYLKVGQTLLTGATDVFTRGQKIGAW